MKPEKTPKLVLKRVLNLPAAVAGFYVQDAVLAEISALPQDASLFRLQEAINNLRKIHQDYASRLAGAFFDYIALASFGEARHGPKMSSQYIHQICFEWDNDDTEKRITVRNQAYRHALKFNPHVFLPTLVHLFDNDSWDSSYGGGKWAQIAEAGTMYGSSSHKVFIDHAVDLSHNCGSMFNKDVLFLLYDSGEYFRMLNLKRSMDSILVYGFVRQFQIATNVKPFLKMAARLNLIDADLVYGNAYEEIQFPEIIKWGLLPITDEDIRDRSEFPHHYNDEIDDEADYDDEPDLFSLPDKAKVRQSDLKFWVKNSEVQKMLKKSSHKGMEQTSLF